MLYDQDRRTRCILAGAIVCVATMLFCLLAVVPRADARDGNDDEGTIFTLWPLVDYRSSPRDGFKNLSLFGPLFKFQVKGEDDDLAVRPLFYRRTNDRNGTASTDYLYPLAGSDTAPESSSFQFLKLLQTKSFRTDEPKNREESSMFFPFYIKGESKKYGPYTSVFPFYGDIYERFWRDEYHYVLFPLYGRTVKGGTTSTNVLYPVFNVVSGEQESGFGVWPLYGQAAKEGVYRRRFVLWPIFMSEAKELNTDHPSSRLYVFPFYAASDSPQRSSRYYLWPFMGYASDNVRKEETKDYFWPFWWTVRGESRNATSFLPFYSIDRGKETVRRWVLWPLYHYDEIASALFREEQDRLLYFLYRDDREVWPKDGASRRKTALWPLFVYRRDVSGVKSFGFPAPVEPVLDKEGIERSWAPFWRIYQQRWNDRGDSAASLLWNLYWHEARDNALAFELFPLLSYRAEERLFDVSFLKGLVRYRDRGGEKRLSLFWLPFGFDWGARAATQTVTVTGEKR